ncbi:hypothetical protein ACF06P_35590 [Streptomyces sp. NPDC015684]|uniref:hypothetical protein n=1 Tax=Streptomyces sp. NPDC015684 TaxID=3364963 RepID=UPI0036FDF921
MASGPEHYQKAERLAEQADEWMDADTGWKANLSSDERITRRRADLEAAQVHATLALAAAAALNDHSDEGGMPLEDYDAWADTVSLRRRRHKGGDPG